MKLNKKYIFLVHSGLTEIVSSRIIEKMIKNSISAKNIYIYHPFGYKPYLLKDFKSFDFPSGVNSKGDSYKSIKKSNFIKLFIISLLKNISIAASNLGGKTIFNRIFINPLSLYRFCSLDLVKEPISYDLNNSHLIIYTPHVRLNMFQYLISLSENYEYHLIEEGNISLRSENEDLLFNQLKLQSIFVDFVSIFLFKSIILIRLLFDIFRISPRSKLKTFVYLYKYIKLPIFSCSYFRLGTIKPISCNFISSNAFIDLSVWKKYEFRKQSTYESNSLGSIYELLGERKKLNIFVLNGKSLNMIRDEFDISLFNSFADNSKILRPHPRHYYLSIRDLLSILNIELSEESINLSEKFRFVPLEIIINKEEFNMIFSRTANRASTSLINFKSINN